MRDLADACSAGGLLPGVFHGAQADGEERDDRDEGKGDDPDGEDYLDEGECTLPGAPGRGGDVTGSPWSCTTLVAPVVGVGLLALFAGGIEPLITVFSLNAAKSIQTPYAITTGDGPWFRYLSDLLLVSPAVVLFAIGGAFVLERRDKPGWFLLGFVVFSYVVMCNLRYGMNLRYANMWDFPLRYLALVPVFTWAHSIHGNGKRRLLVVGIVTLLAIFELANYLRIFVAHDVYDPIPARLLQALDILKS